jgi:thiamine-phosphate pyrophosphorylase
MIPLPRLYAIADASFGDPVEIAQTLIRGGARLLQVRNKNAGVRVLLDQVERILAFAPSDVRVIVNDRADVALLSGAAGVHVGQTDLNPDHVRKILGSDRIVGFSTHNIDQAGKADQLPVDYIAVGPIFPTSTKANPDPVVGLEGLASISKAVHKPVVAVGGITRENAKDVLNAGAHSVAVIKDLLDCPDMETRTREWMEILGRGFSPP